MTTLTFDEGEKFGTAEWRQKMSKNGTVLIENNVRLIVLVHGTFVGNDALGLVDVFEPIINTELANTLRELGRGLTDELADDIGNYTPEYANALGGALGIPCELFKWGSGNYHLARLQGALQLAGTLAALITQNKILANQRVLLQGHSHAGQLFALLTTFLEDGHEAQQIYSIMAHHAELGGAKKRLAGHLKIIRPIHLDFVTFGTPVRYSWGRYNKSRIMAVINHRSNSRVLGILNTEDGDYVQQWGVEGTDMTSPIPGENDRNDSFDPVLDKGRNIDLLIATVEHEAIRRNPKYADGSTVCDSHQVNYQDNGTLPNCIMTIFGHGVYTKKSAMLFNINLIVDNFYPR